MSTDRYTLVIPARPEYLLLARLALTGVARLAQADEEALADLRLAVTEAAANACRHAYADGQGDVTIQLTLSDDQQLEVIVEDDGPGFESESVDRVARGGARRGRNGPRDHPRDRRRRRDRAARERLGHAASVHSLAALSAAARSG